MNDQGLTAVRMLIELDFPAGEDDRRQILTRFGDALDPIRRMLTEQNFRVDTDVHLRFASVHLLARSLSDLLAGGHLASHYYLPQAHSVLRPVIDSCDLMDLFAACPEQAAKWVTTDRPWVDFAPTTVRKLLGRQKLDPVHSYFSEAGSHPRFEGARISGGLAVNPQDPTDQTALFQMGPIWPEHPATLLIWPFVFLLTAETAKCGAHLVPLVDGERAAAELFWLRAFVDCINAGADGAELALTELGELPVGSPSCTEMLEPYVSMRAVAENRIAELGS